MTDTDFVMALAERIDNEHHFPKLSLLLDTVEHLVRETRILAPDWGHSTSVLREAVREPSIDGPVGRAHRLTNEAKKFLQEHSAVEWAGLLAALYDEHVEYYNAPNFINTWAAHAREGMTF